MGKLGLWTTLSAQAKRADSGGHTEKYRVEQSTKGHSDARAHANSVGTTTSAQANAAPSHRSRLALPSDFRSAQSTSRQALRRSASLVQLLAGAGARLGQSTSRQELRLRSPTQQSLRRKPHLLCPPGKPDSREHCQWLVQRDFLVRFFGRQVRLSHRPLHTSRLARHPAAGLWCEPLQWWRDLGVQLRPTRQHDGILFTERAAEWLREIGLRPRVYI